MQDMVIYCERVGDGFWAEPLNALTSLAFLLAALAAFRQLRSVSLIRTQGGLWDIRLLVLLVLLVGVGSLLWQTLATKTAGWADVIPMLAFMNLYLVVFFHRVVGFGTIALMLALTAFQVTLVMAANLSFPGLPKGSWFYLPSLLILLLLAVIAVYRAKARAWSMVVAPVLFALALGFRSIDLSMCLQWSTGTHFLWHLSMAGVLYLVLHGLMSVQVRVPMDKEPA